MAGTRQADSSFTVEMFALCPLLKVESPLGDRHYSNYVLCVLYNEALMSVARRRPNAAPDEQKISNESQKRTVY